MRPTARRAAVTLSLLAVLAAGCGAGGDVRLEQPPLDELPDAPADALPDTGGETRGDGPAAGSDSREVTLATVDAADRTGVPEGDVAVVSFELVTWPDGSLGCPEPGMAYTQATVDGYRLVLDADGRELLYHGAVGDDPLLCIIPEPPAAG